MTQPDVARAPHSHRLAAHSAAIAAPDDLVRHLGPGGFAWIDGDAGFVTSGVVAHVAPPEARALLESIVHLADGDTPAAAGPRAVGALPFSGAGRLVVPARIIARDRDGRAWRTDIERTDIEGTDIEGTGADASIHVAPREPERFTVAPRTTRHEWHAMVRRALDLVERDVLEKVVLARAVEVEADAPFDPRAVLARLRATQPGCVVYGDGRFVGASPELLVRKQGRAVTSRPLAGTASPENGEALLHSVKDRHEHRVVVDAVAAALAACCTGVRVEGPHPLVLESVAHLATSITARSEVDTDVMRLVAGLHPTPAVAGTPRAAALAAIRAIEPVGRDRYAGPCGWVDAAGDGEFVVALRGGLLDGPRATLHAGAGIVAGSDPDAEWAETQAKLTPMVQALVRP